MALEINTRSLEKGLRKLAEVYSADEVLKDMELIGQQLIKRAIEAPVPSDTRGLANSGDVLVDKGRKEVVIGFNKSYAAFQDAPGKTTPHIIKPRRKKYLYVPTSQRGRKHRIGNNPKNEGLIFGGIVRSVGGGSRGGSSSGPQQKADYILAKEVIVPIKPYGSALGPNHYFSETMKRNVKFTLEALAKRLARRLGDKLKPKGGS